MLSHAVGIKIGGVGFRPVPSFLFPSFFPFFFLFFFFPRLFLVLFATKGFRTMIACVLFTVAKVFFRGGSGKDNGGGGGGGE